MNKTPVKCRCGHQVMAKEVLRTDLYERASGRDYIYIKFRCTRCKRLGQTFIPEARFDWTSLESAPDEMTPQERDRALEAGPISTGELMQFHVALKEIASVEQLPHSAPTHNARALNSEETGDKNEKTGTPASRFEHSSPRRRKRKSDKRNNDKRNNDKRDKRNGDNADDEQNAANGSGDDCNAT